MWLTFPTHQLPHHAAGEQSAGLYSLAEAMRLATAIEELCDPSDLDAVSSLCHPDTQQPTVMICDTTPGGIGITESAYRKIRQLLQRALQILKECPYCSKHPESRGCPYCVTAQYGDETTINHSLAITIVQGLLRA